MDEVTNYWLTNGVFLSISNLIGRFILKDKMLRGMPSKRVGAETSLYPLCTIESKLRKAW